MTLFYVIYMLICLDVKRYCLCRH